MRVNVTIVEDRPGAAYAAARKAMIDSQLRPSGISAENVLQRMASVAREDFVPPAAKGFAYSDRAIALGEGRFLAAPIVHALMLQEAEPRHADKALLVDGGSGYLAELLRPLVGSLHVVSPADAASGDDAGHDAGGYSLLIVDGAVAQLPPSLVRLLAGDGRAITGLADAGITRLAVGRRSGDGLALLTLADIGIPALPEFAATPGWSF